MSEQLSEDEAYTPRVEQASIYGEQKMMHAFSEWTTEALEAKAQYYISKIENPETLSKHKAECARLLDHVIFEVTYRGLERGDV